MTASLFERQMAFYSTYHRDRRNRLTHFFGIPAIILALLLALGLARFELGGLGLSLGIAVALAVYAQWIALDRAIGLAMGLFLLPALLFAELLVRAQPAATTWSLFAILFVGGWALQLWGHVYEGRRPALVSNLFQALIGPMFLMAEIFFALGLKQDLRTRVESIITTDHPDYAET